MDVVDTGDDRGRAVVYSGSGITGGPTQAAGWGRDNRITEAKVRAADRHQEPGNVHVDK